MQHCFTVDSPLNNWRNSDWKLFEVNIRLFHQPGSSLKTAPLAHLRPHHRALLGFKRCLTRRGLHDLCWCHKYGDSCRLYDYVHTIMIWCLCSNMRRAIQTCVLCSFRVDMLISICRTSPSSALSLTAAFFAKKNCKGSWIYSSTCYFVFVRTKLVGFFSLKHVNEKKKRFLSRATWQAWTADRILKEKNSRKNVITIFGAQYLSPKCLSLHHKGPSKVSPPVKNQRLELSPKTTSFNSKI